MRYEFRIPSAEKGEAKMAIQSVNPANGQLNERFKAAKWAAVDAVLARAQRTAAVWRDTPMARRREPMLAAAAVLRERTQRYARLITLEMGKPIGQAVAEVEKCAGAC